MRLLTTAYSEWICWKLGFLPSQPFYKGRKTQKKKNHETIKMELINVEGVSRQIDLENRYLFFFFFSNVTFF